MYMAEIDYQICTVTHSTLYAIRHTNHPRLTPRRVHSVISRATADPTWRSREGARPRSKTVLFASCGPQIPFTWANAHWSLWSEQGSKLTLANSQNVSDFDNLRVRKISTSKRLRVRIIHVSQTKGNNLLVVSPVCQWKKILLAKLCKCTKKITSSPGLNIPDSTVLSLPPKLSPMDMLKSDFYTSFNCTCIISLLPAFYSYKKTKMYNMNVILEK